MYLTNICKMYIFVCILPHRKIGGHHPFNSLFLSICQWLAQLKFTTSFPLFLQTLKLSEELGLYLNIHLVHIP